MSLLNELKKITSRSEKRRGRGYGSGKGGHTTGRGQKGQTSREGTKVSLWFEGGALPMNKKMPMWRGKGRLKIVRPTAQLSFDELNSLSLTDITLDSLKLEHVIDKRFKKAKIIKKGKLSRKINVKGLSVSAAARKEIEDLGGTIE